MLLWWLAFFQIREATPEWLVRTQSVCFGTTESGLPNGAGWILLTLGPLSLLFALVTAMGNELRAGVKSVLRTPAGKSIVLLIVSFSLIEAAWATQRVQDGLRIATADFTPEPSTLPDGYPQTDYEAPDFRLVDQHGAELSLEELRGTVTILTFAFAHCQTVCPALVTSTRSALSFLASDQVKLVIVTLDPWRDTPGSLKSLAERWKLPSNAHVLSGAPEEITDLLGRYKVTTTRSETTGDITHPPLVYIISPAGRVIYTFNNPPAAWLRKAAELGLEQTSVNS